MPSTPSSEGSEWAHHPHFSFWGQRSKQLLSHSWAEAEIQLRCTCQAPALPPGSWETRLGLACQSPGRLSPQHRELTPGGSAQHKARSYRRRFLHLLPSCVLPCSPERVPNTVGPLFVAHTNQWYKRGRRVRHPHGAGDATVRTSWSLLPCTPELREEHRGTHPGLG